MFLRRHKRQDRDIWKKTRQRIWRRDDRQCVKCGKKVLLRACHIDHKKELCKGGSNRDTNLRTLCPPCHVLRREFSHRGMTAGALKKGWIGPGWRDKSW